MTGENMDCKEIAQFRSYRGGGGGLLQAHHLTFWPWKWTFK